MTLEAVNGTSITTHGTRSLTLDLGLRRTFRWVFIVAKIDKPILGADFLSHFNLLVDMTHCRLVDTLKSRVSRPPQTPSAPAHPFFLAPHRTNFPLCSLIILRSPNSNHHLFNPSTRLPTTSIQQAHQSRPGHVVWPRNVFVLLVENLNTCWS